MEKKTPPHEHRPLKALFEELKRLHLKLTAPRKAILMLLVQEHGPFSAEDIHRRIPKDVCDLVTVYRTLASLEKANLIKRCEFGDGTARYEIAGKSDHHHHHLICAGCRKVEVLDDCHLDDCHRREIERAAKRKGFSNVSHKLEFFGTCPDCSS